MYLLPLICKYLRVQLEKRAKFSSGAVAQTGLVAGLFESKHKNEWNIGGPFIRLCTYNKFVRRLSLFFCKKMFVLKMRIAKIKTT
jgi:hypothetical protein